MEHYLPMEGSIPSSSNPLLEQVYSIIDSRIQFIDFQVNNYFNDCIDNGHSSSTKGITYHGPTITKTLVENFDNLLQFTGQLHADLKLLQILRAWLDDKTVQTILDLLTDNKYLGFSENKLESLLKKEVLVMYDAPQLS